ncbi:dihydrodipicolinate synthase family protein [Candidatus Poribacteria bacterium]|jgi:2-keto-3-deoxy-L-arabinonate dehydratase|nr:dihydrodipicolinate synthase family protein [Candidatus Poribacteria bacterium]MBT5533222.1 dihydrodipicolinate synthase family protein [Candidatus Poribacteria bacterium]MBT7096518.1 dihydrodipicolinate synthase family protein [Candidatus Poribacteria bacterium]MBT7804261.1 dihydrodipicolinate synthase family protein [Candidatus Poribacteria bacterium]
MADQEARRIAGAVPVLVATFDDTGAVDEDSLRRQIDFCVEAGSDAIAFGMGTESHMLTDPERERMWTVAARQLDGGVPLIAATAHASREGTIALTQLARDCGADGAMVNPAPLGGDDLVALFRDLSERVALPLMIQDANGNAPADVLLRAVREAPRVNSLKLESPGAPDKIGRVVEGLADIPGRDVSVVGGSDGQLLIEEFDRGAVGTLPHPAIIDAFRSVCDLYFAGDASGASEVYYRAILPLSRLTAAGAGNAIWLHKEIFRRAGVLNSAHCRIAADPMPDWVMEAIWRHLDAVDVSISGLLRGKT